MGEFRSVWYHGRYHGGQVAPFNAEVLRSTGVTYVNVREARDEAAQSYGGTGLPETYFISARGEASATIGQMTATSWRRSPGRERGPADRADERR